MKATGIARVCSCCVAPREPEPSSLGIATSVSTRSAFRACPLDLRSRPRPSSTENPAASRLIAQRPDRGVISTTSTRRIRSCRDPRRHRHHRRRVGSLWPRSTSIRPHDYSVPARSPFSWPGATKNAQVCGDRFVMGAVDASDSLQSSLPHSQPRLSRQTGRPGPWPGRR